MSVLVRRRLNSDSSTRNRRDNSHRQDTRSAEYPNDGCEHNGDAVVPAAAPRSHPSPTATPPSRLRRAPEDPLVTPSPGLVDVVEPRAIVVTVTQITGASGDPSATQSSSSLPVGIIVGSVLVGVALAVGIVGAWVWWGKRLKKQGRNMYPPRPSHKMQTSQSSTTRLNRGASATTSPHTSPPSREKPHLHPQDAPNKVPGSRTPGQHKPSSRPPGSSPQRDPSAAPAAGKPNIPPLPTLTTTPPSPDAPTGEEQRQTFGQKSYAPIKSSPLAAKPKPKERAKVNEWARPVTPPLSPTKSSSHGHGAYVGSGFLGKSLSASEHEASSSGETAVSAASSGATAVSSSEPSQKAARSSLAVPREPPAPTGNAKDRVSVLSAESYYAEDDDGAPVGMALDGDDNDDYQYNPPSQHANGDQGQGYRYPPQGGQGGWR
ncbi:hypothetical protein FRB99_000957 [Tulasnella sp. 403]|nr:hypothetical protein FRB99_000957 [Tulasnella sp. 403]